MPSLATMDRTPTSDLVGKGVFLLFLVRHGKAASKDIGLSDFERTLIKKGVQDCTRVLEKINRMKITVDLMISSPADRALETAHLFARGLEYPVHKIQIAEILYTADSIRPVAASIRRFNTTARTVAMIGHNPLFNKLAAHFIPGFSRNIPKGAVAGIEFKASSWAEANKGRGKLAFLLTP